MFLIYVFFVLLCESHLKFLIFFSQSVFYKLDPTDALWRTKGFYVQTGLRKAVIFTWKWCLMTHSWKFEEYHCLNTCLTLFITAPDTSQTYLIMEYFLRKNKIFNVELI